MRLRVPANSLVTDGLDVFPGTADAEMWLVRDSAIAQRSGTPSGSSATHTRSTTCPVSSTTATASGSSSARSASSRSPGTTRCCCRRAARSRVTNALVGGLNFVQQVPARDDRDAVARERDRPGAERAADRGQPARRVLGRRLQRREPLRPPGRPVRQLRLRRQLRLPAGSSGCRTSTTPGHRRGVPGAARADRGADRRRSARARTSCSSRRPRTRTSARSSTAPSRVAPRTTPTASPTRSRSWRSGSRSRAGSPTTRRTTATAPTTAASSRR